MKTRIGQKNLWVDWDTGEVTSYTTHVADIVGRDLLIYGKYSATTSKQMTQLAQLYNLTKIQLEKKHK